MRAGPLSREVLMRRRDFLAPCWHCPDLEYKALGAADHAGRCPRHSSRDNGSGGLPWPATGRTNRSLSMRDEPAKFLAVAANVLPKDVNVKHEATDAFVNLWKLISDGTAEQA